MKTYREIIHRCLNMDYPDLPFRVRALGHANITPEIVEPKVKRDFIEMYWCLEDEGTFNIDGKKHQLHPGEVCFYTFGDLHDLHASTPYFHYRWLTFDGPLAMPLWQGLNLQKTPRLVGPCPEELYCRLEREIIDYSLDGLRKATGTAFQILMLAACSPKSVPAPCGHAERAKQIIDENFGDPMFNINALAKGLQTNRSQLSRKFSSYFGIGPDKYLIQQRIQRGINLISSTPLSIGDIVRQCGFSDPDYFSRCIRKYDGRSPKQIRGTG